jgi:hypothetical protein
MNREVHVRFCERLRGRFPRPTRLAQILCSWVVVSWLRVLAHLGPALFL